MSEIHRVARKGDPFSLRRLIEEGADPNERLASDGGTPVMSAAEGDRMINVRTLVSLGADLSLKSDRGGVALSKARTFAMRRLLLELGAHPDEEKVQGMTLTAVWANFARWDMVRLYLEFGADPHAKLRDGRTVIEALENPTDVDRRKAEFSKIGKPGIDEDILKMSNHLQISPEEYVGRNPRILIWSFASYIYSDPALQAWAQRVFELMRSTDERAACYIQQLDGEALGKALHTVERQKRNERHAAEIKRLDLEYEAIYFPRS